MNLQDAFIQVQTEFPFPEYMDLNKYKEIISIIQKEYPNGARILSIGSGPCDLESVLAVMGYEVTAVDDLEDPWHKMGKNRERIINFANNMGIKFFKKNLSLIEFDVHFDIVLLIDIIEHLHESPMGILNTSLTLLKEKGLLIIKTPNIAALKKRLALFFGKNVQSADFFYWNIGPFRAHVIEYTKSDIYSVLSKQGINPIKVKIVNHATDSLIANENNSLKKLLYGLYKVIVTLIPNSRDTIIIYGYKPTNWQPKKPSVSNFKKYHKHIAKYNLDGLPEEDIIHYL